MQGDLTDPSYFDFITFAQLATISQEIPIGQQAFEVSHMGISKLLSRSAMHHRLSCAWIRICLAKGWETCRGLYYGSLSGITICADR